MREEVETHFGVHFWLVWDMHTTLFPIISSYTLNLCKIFDKTAKAEHAHRLMEWITLTVEYQEKFKFSLCNKNLFKCLDVNKTGCMISYLHCHLHLLHANMQFILHDNTHVRRHASPIIYCVFPVPWLL